MNNRSNEPRQSGRKVDGPPDTERNRDQTSEGESSEDPAEGGEETAPRQPGSPG